MSIIKIKKSVIGDDYNIRLNLKNSNSESIKTKYIFDDFIKETTEKNISKVVDYDTEIYTMSDTSINVAVLKPNSNYGSNALSELEINSLDENIFLIIEFYTDKSMREIITKKIVKLNNNTNLNFGIDNDLDRMVFLPNHFKKNEVYSKFFFYNGNLNKLTQLANTNNLVNNNSQIHFKFNINIPNRTITLADNSVILYYGINNTKFNERLENKTDTSPIIKSSFKQGVMSVIDTDNNQVVIE